MIDCEVWMPGENEPFRMSGTAAGAARMLSGMLSRIGREDVLTVTWQVGCGHEEMTLNPKQSLKENIEEALDQLRTLEISFESGPAGEESAFALCHALLLGLEEMERGSA